MAQKEATMLTGKKTKTAFRTISALLLTATMAVIAVWASTLSITYKTVTDGQTLTASMWNTNFSQIENGVNSIDTANITDGSVSLADLGTGSVDSSKIVDASVAAVDLAPDSVDSSEIVTNAVGSDEIADDSIGNLELTDAACPGVLSMFVSQSNGSLDVSSTDYCGFHITDEIATPGISVLGYCVGGSHKNVDQTTFPIAMSIHSLYVHLETAPGTDNSYAFTIRADELPDSELEGDFAATAVTCTVSGTDQHCEYTGSPVSLVQGAVIVLESVPASTPTSAGDVRVSLCYSPG